MTTATFQPLPAGAALDAILAGTPVLVTFRKRTDGTLRTMLCTALDTPVKMLRKGLVFVRDLDVPEGERPFRSLPFEEVASVRPLATA